jgi:hypothetical protein
MNNVPKGTNVNCEWFLNELEMLPADGRNGAAPEKFLTGLPEAAREHASQCAPCESALQDFAETRNALEGMKAGPPEAGPWFVVRVMAAIRSKEEAIEEQRNGVWISVRRLAPRLVAFAALLLILGGSWAVEVRRTERLRQTVMRPAEGIFDTAPVAPVDEELVASVSEEKLP